MESSRLWTLNWQRWGRVDSTMRGHDVSMLRSCVGPMRTISRQLISLCRRPVPESARERAAKHVLDWVACAVAAAQTEPAHALHAWAEGEWPEDGRAHVLRVGSRSMWTAAL